MRLLNEAVQRQKWLDKHLFLNHHEALSENWCQPCALTSETRSQSVVIAIKQSVQNPCEEGNVVFKCIWAWHVCIRAKQDTLGIKVLILIILCTYGYRGTCKERSLTLSALYTLSRNVLEGRPSGKSTNMDRLRWQLY